MSPLRERFSSTTRSFSSVRIPCHSRSGLVVNQLVWFFQFGTIRGIVDSYQSRFVRHVAGFHLAEFESEPWLENLLQSLRDASSELIVANGNTVQFG